jgi:hypothetical protein
MKKFLLALILGIIVFTSCDDDIVIAPTIVIPGYGTSVPTYVTPGTTNGNGEYAITFGSYTPFTRAAQADGGVSGFGYDDFNLFSWNSDDVVMNPFHVTAYGEGMYAYVGVDNQDTLYFKNVYNDYKFIGVIPRSVEMNKAEGQDAVNVYGVESFTIDEEDLNEKTVDTPKEFLYCKTTVEKTNYKNSVNLNFKHGNAKVYLKFISDDVNTKIVDFTPYTPGSPEVPATPGTQTTTTKTGKALDMLYAGEIVYWPYAGDATLTSTQANNFYKNETNYGNMGSLMDAVNAQFVYYDTSGDVTTDAWVEGSAKKDTYGIQLASLTNKDDFIGGATEDTWKDAFWKNASTQIKDVFRPSYAAGWRVIRIEHIAGTQYDAWLLNNTEMTYKVITTTGGTPYQPAVPATGTEGIIILPANSTIGDGSNAVKTTLTKTANVVIPVNGDAVYSEQSTIDRVIYSVPSVNITSTAIRSNTIFYALPKKNLTDGMTIKFSYTYKGTTIYDARVWVPSDMCKFSEGYTYTYTINIKGFDTNGVIDPTEADEDDPTVKKSNGIGLNVNVSNYETSVEKEYVIQ